MSHPAIRRTVFAMAAVAVAAAGVPSAQSTTPPLRIVLTNDDGYQAAGLEAMRKALVAAGHTVSVVAPFEDHSGAGASMTTSGMMKVESKGDGIWAVHGTPADSALVAVRHLFRQQPPDLVVSGINRGQNLGTSSNSSPAADEGDTDLALFARGFVTLTVLDGDWGAASTAGDATASRLMALTLPVKR